MILSPRMLKRLLFSYMLAAFLGLFGFCKALHVADIPFSLLVASSLLMAVCMIAITRYFYINPILLMIDATQRIKNGDFTQRINVRYHNELGELVRNLNEMSAVLEKQIHQMTNDKNELQAILSSLVEGVVVIGRDERMVYLSPNFCDLLDVRSREATGRLYWEVIRNQQINDTIKKAMAVKKAAKMDIKILGSKDTFFSMQVSPVFNEHSELMSVVAIFHDITEHKRFENLRTEFVANVSHELKTPLTSIKGFVETLQGGALKDPENAKRFLDIIEKQTVRLENLVNDLLTLSSLESQELRMDFQKGEIAVIINSVVNLHKGHWERMGQSIQIDVGADLPVVKIDRQRMEQVFLNLLDNAIKFTPQGKEIFIDAVRENGFIRVNIRDTGIGIGSEHIPRLFERFYRVDKARSRELGGTGLGLSIVKHIIQAHKGKVDVVSKLGVGTTFSVYLPLENS